MRLGVKIAINDALYVVSLVVIPVYIFGRGVLQVRFAFVSRGWVWS
jgi:uncharacterized membrane protein